MIICSRLFEGVLLFLLFSCLNLALKIAAEICAVELTFNTAVSGIGGGGFDTKNSCKFGQQMYVDLFSKLPIVGKFEST